MSEPLTILHVCSITSRGGTGYMASHLCRLLKERGHRVIVAPRAGGKVEERARADGLELLTGLKLRPGFRPLDLWRDVMRLRRFLHEERVQIVNAWHSIEYWTCALATLGTEVKLCRTRGLVTPVRSHIFNRLLHNRTAALFATCQAITETYRDAGFSMDNIFHLQDGVDTECFRPGGEGRPVRQALGLGPETPLIANVGRLQDVKGQDTFVRAIASLPTTVHGMIAGDGPAREELQRLVRELGVTNRLHFLGVRGDIPAVLAAADVYVLCSIGSEGSSRATLEAMACGLPCVTTTVGMLPDIIKPGRTGLLFTPHAVEELVECLENLLADQGLRQRLGREARAFVETRHSERAMAVCAERAYQQILDGTGTDGAAGAGEQAA